MSPAISSEISDTLLCSDLDRTILPNGAQPESFQARPLLHRLANHPQLTLAYVSGRHRELIQAAIAEYDIPVPAFAVGDVGTTIYSVDHKGWHVWSDWLAEIAGDWCGAECADIANLFVDLNQLHRQEPEKQNRFKLSYYLPLTVERAALFTEMEARLVENEVRASLVWSIDEALNVGLLDVLPASATKVHAVRFLRQRLGIETCNTVFAGDSGNDLPVLVSELQSVLVANAHSEVVAEAKAILARQGDPASLYCAKGGFVGMNGNYSAGVLEGFQHYCPSFTSWLLRDHTS